MIFQYFKYSIFKSKHTGKYHTNNTIKILLLLSVNLGSSSFGVISFCLFILFIGFRECSSHSKHLIPTAQEKNLHMDITRWSILISDWLYSLQQRWRSSIQSAKTRPGADHGSDHEVLTAKFRLKLKKVGKTTRAFWYDLNQILMIIQWRWRTDSKD